MARYYEDIKVLGGTVSIGGLTGNGGYIFSVYGDSSVSGTISSARIIASGSTDDDLVRITQRGSGNSLVVEDEANPDSTPFVVGPSGNVSVGTSSTNNKLHVYGGTTRFEATASHVEFIKDGHNSFSIGHDSNKLYFSNSTTSNTVLTFLNNSNVGINNTSPSHMLTVGTVSNGAAVALYGNTSGRVVIRPRENAGSWTASLPFNTGTITDFVYLNFGGELFLNDGQGNLFFGTTPSLSLSQNQFFIGNTYGYAQRRTLSGDIENDYLGVVTIKPTVVSYSKIQDVTSKSLLGSITGSGSVVEIPIYDAFLPASSATTYLSDPSNWTGVTYSGPSITGTYQGQNHYDGTYYFVAVGDDLWIRINRA